MKRILFLVLVVSQLALFGQTGVYQLPDGGFETWEGDQNSRPSYWNGFPTGQCDLTGLAALGCGTAKARRHQRDVGRPGSLGQYSVQLFSTSAFSIVANGNMTTGIIRMGSTTPANAGNYNYTKRSDANHYQIFAGRPDSVKFWAKLDVNNHSTTLARLSAVLHGDVDYKDPADGATGRIGHAAYNFSCPDKNWHEYSYPFSYDNNTTPSYILVSLTTNATPGGGSNGDKAYFDDIEFIYNIYLNDLKIAGVTPSNFHKDTLTYNYYLCRGEAIPAVTYTGSSPRADILKDSMMTATGNITTIEVRNTGNPNLLQTYTVNFIYHNVVQAPTAQNVSLCGAGQVILSATVGTNGTICRWYSDTMSTPISTGTSYSLGQCTKDTVLFVSSYNATTGCESYKIPVSVKINAIPGTPIVINDTICGAGTLNLSATAGANGTVCRWYASNTSTTILAENTSFNISTNKDTSFWVSSYNTTSGCESGRVEMKAVVNPMPQTPIVYNDSICGSGLYTLNVQSPQTGIEYIWYTSNDTPLDTANSYTQTFTETTLLKVASYNSQTGCQSEDINVTLTVNPLPEVPSLETVYCAEETLVLTPIVGEGGTTINWYNNVSGGSPFRTGNSHTLSNLTPPQSFVYYLTSTNITTKCESERTAFAIQVHPIYNIVLEPVEQCDSYLWNDSLYTESGLQSKTFESVSGCDSIVSIFINIIHSVTTNIKDTICQGITYQKHGFDLIATSSNTYKNTLTAVNGCDSIIELDLKVYPSYYPDTIRASICGISASYPFFGRFFTETGIYDTIIKTIHGCDSLIVLDLTVSDAFRESVNITKCYGETYFFKEENLTETGIYRDTLQASNGCDSIVILTLVINDQILPTILTIDTCSSYTWNDSIYTKSTSHNTIFSAADGCDSIVTLNLTINHPVTNQVNEITCVSYLWNGELYESSGEYTDTLVAANGCDSIVTLNLIINEPVTLELYDTACMSYDWKDSTYTTSTVLADTVFNGAANGCDSITTLNLTIKPIATAVFDSTVCGSFTWEGTTYTQSEILYDTIFGGAANGCDSVTIINLTINEAVVNEYYETACESFLWKGTTYTQSEILYDTIFGGAANTCDSVTIINLTINEAVVNEYYETACESFLWKGTSYTQSEILYDTLFGGASNACDSIVILHLTVNYPEDTLRIYDNVCQGDTYTENGFDLPAQAIIGTKTYYISTIDCDTVIELHLTVNRSYLTGEITRIACDSYTWNDSVYYESGNYVQTFNTVYGCDSIVTLQLTINSSSDSVYIIDEICQGETYTENGFNLLAQEVAGVFEYSFNPKNSSGCDSIIHLTLTVHPAGNFRIQDTIKVGETYSKHGFDITPEISGIYRDTLYLTSFYDCDSTIVLLLIAQKETSIKEQSNMEQTVHLFPNPAQNQITISASIGIKQIEIYDIDGKLLDVVPSKDSMEIVYNINRYSTGLYFVKIQTANGTFTKKLIVQ